MNISLTTLKPHFVGWVVQSMAFWKTTTGQELILKGVSQAGMDICWDITFQTEALKKIQDSQVNYTSEEPQFSPSLEDSSAPLEIQVNLLLYPFNIQVDPSLEIEEMDTNNESDSEMDINNESDSEDESDSEEESDEDGQTTRNIKQFLLEANEIARNPSKQARRRTKSKIYVDFVED